MQLGEQEVYLVPTYESTVSLIINQSGNVSWRQMGEGNLLL